MSHEMLDDLIAQLEFMGEDGMKYFEEAMRMHQLGYSDVVAKSPEHRDSVRMVRWLFNRLLKDAAKVRQHQAKLLGKNGMSIDSVIFNEARRMNSKKQVFHPSTKTTVRHGRNSNRRRNR